MERRSFFKALGRVTVGMATSASANTIMTSNALDNRPVEDALVGTTFGVVCSGNLFRFEITDTPKLAFSTVKQLASFVLNLDTLELVKSIRVAMLHDTMMYHNKDYDGLSLDAITCAPLVLDSQVVCLKDVFDIIGAK